MWDVVTWFGHRTTPVGCQAALASIGTLDISWHPWSNWRNTWRKQTYPSTCHSGFLRNRLLPLSKLSGCSFQFQAVSLSGVEGSSCSYVRRVPNAAIGCQHRSHADHDVRLGILRPRVFGGLWCGEVPSGGLRGGRWEEVEPKETRRTLEGLWGDVSWHPRMKRLQVTDWVLKIGMPPK